MFHASFKLLFLLKRNNITINKYNITIYNITINKLYNFYFKLENKYKLKT